MNHSEIIHKINTLQKEQQITNEKLAELSGLGIATIYRLKAGSETSITTLIKILEALKNKIEISPIS